jgi:hypothetical protein
MTALPQRPSQIPTSVLRQALLDGPSAVDPAGLVLVELLDSVGLLAVREVVDQTIDLAVDGSGTVMYAELDLEQVLAVANRNNPRVSDTAHRILSAAVGLADLAAGLPELELSARIAALTALARYLQNVAPQAGLTVSLSPADTAAAFPVPSTAGGTR